MCCQPQARPRRRKVPASLLQAARLSRGWSQQDVIDRIQMVCQGHGRGPCKIGVTKLSEFETNKRRPTLQHAEALCRVFRMGPEDLGLINWRINPQRVPLAPVAGPSTPSGLGRG